MIIQSSNIILASQHAALQQTSRTESLAIWLGDRPSSVTAGGRPAPPADRVQVRLSPSALAARQGESTRSERAHAADKRDDSLDDDPVMRLVRMLTELITGKKIKVTMVKAKEDGTDQQKAAELSQDARDMQALAQPQPQQPGGSGFGLAYDSRETYLETERSDFSAQGVVRTADGAEIGFNLQLSMQRAFTSEKAVSVRLGAAAAQKDPLVINFNGASAQLSETKFTFDLDSDGSSEQVSFVAPNSGFLSLDRNGDGVINNGGELFGATSGNGFNDLASFDRDTNGWIDENDPVFNQLKVWSKDSGGNDMLTGLKALGVGALYLGNVSTPFELKNGSNSSLGTIRTSGIYLNENGSSGTLQQLDLTL